MRPAASHGVYAVCFFVEVLFAGTNETKRSGFLYIPATSRALSIYFLLANGHNINTITFTFERTVLYNFFCVCAFVVAVG